MCMPRANAAAPSIWVHWCGGCRVRDLSLPLLMRFDDILEDGWSGSTPLWRAIAHRYAGRTKGRFSGEMQRSSATVVEQLMESGRRCTRARGAQHGRTADRPWRLLTTRALLILQPAHRHRYMENGDRWPRSRRQRVGDRASDGVEVRSLRSGPSAQRP